MHLPEFVYLEPKTLSEALQMLGKHGNSCGVIAGGTDLLVALKQRLLNPAYLISLDKIPALKKVEVQNNTIKLGPLNTLGDVAFSVLIKEKLPALSQAAREVASPTVRQTATIGGNICLNTRCRFYNQSLFWRAARDKCFKAGGTFCHVTSQKNKCSAAFVADTAPVLIAFQARIKLVGPTGERTLPLKDFYTGDGRAPNQLLAGSKEILTAIEIPLPAENERSIYKKFRLRHAVEFPLIGVAVSLGLAEGNHCRSANIALTGVGSAPFIAEDAEQELLGKKWETEQLAAAAKKAVGGIHPLKTGLVSPRYLREVARIMIMEALQEAGGKNGENN